MAEYIEREKAWRKVNWAENIEEALHLIDSIPAADVVPVVRCVKCRHYNTSGCADGFGWCEHFNRGEMDEHYCSYGERRCE